MPKKTTPTSTAAPAQTRQLKKRRRRPGPKPARKLVTIQGAFLEAYRQKGTIWHAAKDAGIDRQTHYNWLKTDPAYAAKFEIAEDEATDTLELEARRRAVQGVEEPVFYKGEECGSIRRMSDTLLIFLLKGARPNKYRERFEHSGPNGGPIQASVSFYIPDNGRGATA